MKATNVTAKVYSYKQTTKQLQQFIEQCQVDYDAFLDNKLNQNMYYFVYDKVCENECVYGFKKVKFESSKTFDNVFFKEKTALKRRLDFFENHKDMYDKLGIPHTFGVLMHGEPGTGKTSTIKAIANYTKRHIIAIPLYKIKDISVLMKLFLNVEIDGVNVPFNKRIYVFEEIDCNGLKDIVQHRRSSNKRRGPSQVDKNEKARLQSQLETELADISPDKIQTIMALATVSSKNETSNAKTLTLGGILELLDGLVETPGRILIITTNHPDELDEALIRPGRIDMNLEFTKASREDIASMYEMWYNKTLDDVDMNTLQEVKFTHAELCQLFFNNLNDPLKALTILQTPSSTELCANT
jgi:chaperone BCS1